MKKLLCILLLLSSAAFAADTIAMSNAAILYSPYNWNVAGGQAKTINTGAYIRTIFDGTSVSLATDTTNNITPFTYLWARVDNGPWVALQLAAGNPTLSVATGLVSRKHVLEVVVKANSETITRWSATSQVMVTLTGIVVDTGKTLTAPVRRSKNILIFGDSITEGTLVNGSASPDSARNDVLQDYAYMMSTAVDAEVGIVGFGGTGITVGANTVPALPSAYNLIYTGVSRSFTSPAPDLVIYNEGTNDSGSITTGLQTVINGILATAPMSKHLILVPFNGGHLSEIQAAVAAIGNSSVTYQSTTGWYDAADGVHPLGYNHIGLIAPKLFPVVASALYGSSGGLVSYAF